MNDKGKKGFYLYDQAEKTMQRYTNRTVVKEPEPMTLIEKLTSDTKLLAVVGTLEPEPHPIDNSYCALYPHQTVLWQG